APPEPHKFSAKQLAAFAGEYESESFWAKLQVKNGELTATFSGQPTHLTPVAPLRFLADSRLYDSLPLEFERNSAGDIVGFETALARIGRQHFRRVEAQADAPRAWKAY